MKKILSALIVVLAGYCASPQILKTSEASKNPEVSTAVSISESNDPASTIAPKNVSTKAVRNFKKTFKNVTDEQWYDMPDGYRAKFTSNNISYRLDYDKNGTWLHTIRYYDEKKLPVDVRQLVAGNYLDYTVRTVEEIAAPRSTTIYVIHLEGQTNWINIRVQENEISELQKIKKS